MNTLIVAAVVAVIAFAVYRRRRRSADRIDITSVRTIAQGELLGLRVDQDRQAWLGIPYAQPPVGELRWRAPRAPDPWSGRFEATRYGNRPAQLAGIGGGFPRSIQGRPVGSEDCLYLNVWAPVMTPNELAERTAALPVFLWIYGGGNAVGAADVSLYANARRLGGSDAILVSLNYRLGVFGWFRHPAIFDADCSKEDRSGNFGTLDLIQGLRWVRENIAAFGGDPGNVTIFGESAGGINVASLMLSPLARGLFHRAIAQSPLLTSYTVAEAENYASDASPGHRNSSRESVLRWLVTNGRAADVAEARDVQDESPGAELRSFLSGLTADQLLKPFMGELAEGLYTSPRPIEDGHVLPAVNWKTAFADPSLVNHVPFIIGTNADEHKAFICADTDNYIDLRLGMFPRIRDLGRYERDARYSSRMWQAAVGEHALMLAEASSAAVFVYRFDWDDWPSFFGLSLRQLMGAFHAAELFFLFGVFQKKPWLRWFMGIRRFGAILARSAAMQSYWLEFARTGDPGTGLDRSLPAWNEITGESASTMHIGPPGPALAVERRGVLTVAEFTEQLATDADLDSGARAYVYAQTLAFGFHGNWERPGHPALQPYGPSGAMRQPVELARDRMRFRP